MLIKAFLDSVIIANFDIEGIAIGEPKADAPLIVYGDSVLSFPVSAAGVELVTRRYLEVFKLRHAGCSEPHGWMKGMVIREF